MTEEDAVVAEEAGGRSRSSSRTRATRSTWSTSDPEAYDAFYSVIANPQLWFTQHYLWDLSNAPDIRAEEKWAWETATRSSTRTSPREVLRQVEGREEPLVMFHDYHLYTAPGNRPRGACRTPSSITSSTSRGRTRTPGGSCRAPGARRSSTACWPTTSSASTPAPTSTTSSTAAASWSELRGRLPQRRRPPRGPRDLGPRLPARDRRRAAASRRRHRRGRRVRARAARAPPRAPDHPRRPRRPLQERPARVHRLRPVPRRPPGVPRAGHVHRPPVPSRTDVAEYQEYLERIEALVAVVNHRHGTTDWMPIDLRMYENFHEAVARYKHFDLLMVNSLFDGMNLVAKEAPAVNTRDGVLMLSENTGAHEELGECALSVNPFDIEEQAEAIHRALTMDAGASAASGPTACARSSTRPIRAAGSTTSWPTSRPSGRAEGPKLGPDGRLGGGGAGAGPAGRRWGRGAGGGGAGGGTGGGGAGAGAGAGAGCGRRRTRRLLGAGVPDALRPASRPASSRGVSRPRRRSATPPSAGLARSCAGRSSVAFGRPHPVRSATPAPQPPAGADVSPTSGSSGGGSGVRSSEGSSARAPIAAATIADRSRGQPPAHAHAPHDRIKPGEGPRAHGSLYSPPPPMATLDYELILMLDPEAGDERARRSPPTPSPSSRRGRDQARGQLGHPQDGLRDRQRPRPTTASGGSPAARTCSTTSTTR